MNKLRSLFYVFALLFSINFVFSGTSEKSILVLQSYKQGYVWTDNISQGVLNYFGDRNGIDVDIEYLDSQEFSGNEYEKAFLKLLKQKYGTKNRPDAVIVADNPAFEFILSNENELFPGTPIVFCGINNFHEDMISGKTNFTGVVEEISMKENLETVFRLHPHAKRLYVCLRNNPTGRANKKLLFTNLSNLQRKMEVRLIDDDAAEDAQKKINKISREDVLLLMTIYKNSRGEILPAGISTRTVLSNSVVPVYSFWDFNLGNGIIGGKMVNGYDQGSNAAAITWRVLGGEDIRKIPVLLNSPNRFMFDQDQLTRFGIAAGSLPQGSVITHQPKLLLEKYKTFITLVFILLFTAVLVLVIHVFLQRKSKKVLSEVNDFQQNLFDSIPNPVYTKDMKMRYTGCNKSYEDFFGTKKENLVGKSVFDIFPMEQAELFDSMDKELLGTGKRQEFESEVRHAGGDTRTVISLKTMFYWSNRQPFGIIGVFIDITEQKKMLVELNRAKEKAELMNLELETNRNYLNKIINSISDPVFVKDGFHNWVLLNDAYCEFMGYKREELLGKSDRDFFPRGQADIFWENDDTVLRSIVDNVSEEEFTDKSGKVHTIITKKSIFVDGKGNKFIVGIISDISERKKLENELKLVNQNLGERVWEEVNKNREKDLVLIKQSRQASMGEMIRNIAHQWRQPLNALGIHIQNVREHYRIGTLDEDYINKTVDKSIELIQFMSRTIDDFKDFFKPDKEMTRFSVKDALFRAISVVEASMKNNFIEIEILLEKEVYAQGYPNEYSQVVLNILSNAKDILIESRNPRPRVRIVLTESEGKTELLIWNNGGVIPDNVINRVFEPYFTTKETGTGIGLYMSKMIIEKSMKGKIGVRNLDGGAEFSITVP